MSAPDYRPEFLAALDLLARASRLMTLAERLDETYVQQRIRQDTGVEADLTVFRTTRDR